MHRHHYYIHVKYPPAISLSGYETVQDPPDVYAVCSKCNKRTQHPNWLWVGPPLPTWKSLLVPPPPKIIERPIGDVFPYGRCNNVLERWEDTQKCIYYSAHPGDCSWVEASIHTNKWTDE